ncbi:MAG: hypothetical protein V4805_12605 [Pseudomonadota bacterium]
MQPQYITLKGRAKNITGQRFGRLVALGPVSRNRHKQIIWLFQCDCGNTRAIARSDLRNGHTKSCGCLRDETLKAIGASAKTHGMSKTPIYRTWLHMRKRCGDPSNKNYADYGGRGIHVCDKWQNSFETFHDHVSPLTNFGKRGYTLDRINNNGHYEPGNVHWATTSEQQSNRRNSVVLTLNGKTQCLAAWAKELGVPRGRLESRIRYGWNDQQILIIPLRGRV